MQDEHWYSGFIHRWSRNVGQGRVLADDQSRELMFYTYNFCEANLKRTFLAPELREREITEEMIGVKILFQVKRAHLNGLIPKVISAVPKPTEIDDIDVAYKSVGEIISVNPVLSYGFIRLLRLSPMDQHVLRLRASLARLYFKFDYFEDVFFLQEVLMRKGLQNERKVILLFDRPLVQFSIKAGLGGDLPEAVNLTKP